MASPQFELQRPTLTGATTDARVARTLHVLRSEGINPVVTMEFAATRPGILCGISEVRALLEHVLPQGGVEVWCLDEAATVEAGEVSLRVKAPYGTLGQYETAITGTLSSCTGWATAARECVDAAEGIPVVSTGARRIHPAVAGMMDYAAVIGGCASCTTSQGAKLAGVTLTEGMTHSMTLILGDVVRSLQAFDRHTQADVPRIALVDTLRDEAEEAIAAAKTLRQRLRGIAMDTARERGGVRPELVNEVRARLDISGFRHVEITVTGGLDPDRISTFVRAGAAVQRFGVGTYIASAPPNCFMAEIHDVDGRPTAKRGRSPGTTVNPRLNQVM